MGNKKKERRRGPEPEEAPVDLAARIGARPAASPEDPPAPSPPPADTSAEMPPETPEVVEDVRSPAIPVTRLPPGPGETDLVITPLPTPDDWHRFELALRAVRGVSQLRPEYYRHGVLKVRVSYEGPRRLALALRDGIPGYRVRVIGEDRTTLQVLVSPENDDRRPG